MEKKNIHSENNSHKRYEATALPTYRMSDTCNISSVSGRSVIC